MTQTTWSEIRAELEHYPILDERPGRIRLRGRPGVEVRHIRAHDVDWLTVLAPIAAVSVAPLARLLEASAAEPLGAIVIDEGSCFVRERMWMAQLAPTAVHALLVTVLREASRLRALVQASEHPYAELFST
jgi:hypothetical protein